MPDISIPSMPARVTNAANVAVGFAIMGAQKANIARVAITDKITNQPQIASFAADAKERIEPIADAAVTQGKRVLHLVTNRDESTPDAP